MVLSLQVMVKVPYASALPTLSEDNVLYSKFKFSEIEQYTAGDTRGLQNIPGKGVKSLAVMMMHFEVLALVNLNSLLMVPYSFTQSCLSSFMVLLPYGYTM